MPSSSVRSSFKLSRGRGRANVSTYVFSSTKTDTHSGKRRRVGPEERMEEQTQGAAKALADFHSVVTSIHLFS